MEKDSNEAESGLLLDTYFLVCQDGRNGTKMCKNGVATVVRKCGVDPLTNTNVSKSPEHIAFAQSTLSTVVGTPFIV